MARRDTGQARRGAARRTARAAAPGLALLGLALLAVGAGVSSCRSVSTETDADDALVERLIGRWRGEAAADAPAGAWWQGTSWDLVFTPSGEVSAVAATTVGARPRELRFLGEYAVRYGKVLVDEPSLGGVYGAVFEEAASEKKTLRLTREGDVAQAPDPEEARLRLVLEPRFGEYRAR